MRALTSLFVLSLLTGCLNQRGAEEPSSWYDNGLNLDVTEPILYTDQVYDFPGNTTDGIAHLKSTVFPGDGSNTLYATGQSFDTDGCDALETADLPYEIEGIVTIHPRFYFKSRGCDRASDEKFYGSFFLQDGNDAVFVLGDSKSPHFTAGDRVKMRVRATKSTFGLDMIYSHDILSIERGPEPIFYELQEGIFRTEDIGRTKRVIGTVVSEPDTFGQFSVRPDDALFPCEVNQAAGCVYIQLDSEISRRGLSIPPGQRVQLTGPIQFAYSTYTLVIMNHGQVTLLND